MDYLELKIKLPKEKVDLVSTFLVAGGYDTFEICDHSDLIESAGEMFCDYIEDDLFEKQSLPPEIKFYFDAGDREKAEEILSFVTGVCKNLGYTDVSGEITLVENSDWDTRWKQYFYPFPVGDKLFIKPCWEEVEEETVGNRAVIDIDPAAAFGSGTHDTTRLCLEGVERELVKGDKVLDMGCGSGILGIGAIKLGASSCVSVDIDDAAVRTAKENFEKNGILSEDNIFLCGDIISDTALRAQMGGEFDLICANIVAGIIGSMAPYLYTALKKDGTLLASGILEEREEEIKAILLSAGFRLVSTHRSGGWVCLTLRK